MFKFKNLLLVLSLVILSISVFSEGVVNLYTNRHYDSDEKLYQLFEDKTGIKVNVLKGDSDQLIERIYREGKNTSADLLITADAGRLVRAKQKMILQEINSDILNENIPNQYKDPDGYWFGLTMRARVVVLEKDSELKDDINTYYDLTKDKFKQKILIRSSTNIYNQSLLASLIEIDGYEKAKEWAEGIVENMSRTPQGNDRDQAKGIIAGEGEVAVMNTYYLGKMLNSLNDEEVEVGEQLEIKFLENTHVNISGIGLTKNSKNRENAIKFIEFLSSQEAQEVFAKTNYEYPVNLKVEASDLLKSWGDFNTQDINLSKLGENNTAAVLIFNQVNWK
jgi:iron(III) transport system substrate-binding protein